MHGLLSYVYVIYGPMCPSTDGGSAGRVKKASSPPQEAGDLVMSSDLSSVSVLT